MSETNGERRRDKKRCDPVHPLVTISDWDASPDWENLTRKCLSQPQEKILTVALLCVGLYIFKYREPTVNLLVLKVHNADDRGTLSKL